MTGILQGKVAVITGSTRGLGLAIAQTYAREGAAVVIASRTQNSVDEAVRLLQKQDAKVSGMVCDVANFDQVQKLAQMACNTFGDFDIWVNNAGISAPYGPTAHVPQKDFSEVLQTNIVGVYNGSVTAMRHFIQKASGKLINLLGRGDRSLSPMQNAYGSSKAWVRSFTLTLAKEYRQTGIGVFAFNPGLITTDLLAKPYAIAGYEHRLAPFKYVVSMWGNPPQVPAEKALWLASSATDGKTGLNVSLLKFPALLAGSLRYAFGKLFGRQIEEFEYTVQSVPAAIHVNE